MTGLFRREAEERQASRLHGEVLLLPKLSHFAVSTFILVWVVSVVIWLASSNYSRKETVTGWLEPASGVVRVYAGRAGIVHQLLVKEGERVEAGQSLIVVKGNQGLKNGAQLEMLLLSEFESQRELLKAQIERGAEMYRQRKKGIDQQVRAAEEELALLGRQVETQARRFALVKEQVERYRSLRKSGHVSSSDYDSAVARQLELHYENQTLKRNRINLRTRLQKLQTEQALQPGLYSDNVAQLKARLSTLAGKVAELRSQEAYVIRASAAGVVSNLQVGKGQQVQTAIPVLSLVPEGQALNAQLLVPARSAGFLERGQSLNIRYDAFPYQKFGLYQGHIVEVSDTILLPDELMNTPVHVREPVFRVTAELVQSTVSAYGRDFALKPGMMLSADVELSQRSLLQWLLEPLYSLRGRL